jgi:hypothetical protein
MSDKISPTIQSYKDKMKRLLYLYNPHIDLNDIDSILDYSISKRLYNANAGISNSYKRYIDPETQKFKDLFHEYSLLQIADYIKKREPIVTSQGTMFKHHGEVPNPLADTIQSFLDLRGIHKKDMFKYPKGSEMFEKYNLMQQLDKIDANGIYGVLGMYTSLLYNVNVASSITSQGRSLISSATLVFESFLANNVKFGSLDQCLEFINNIVTERKDRKFKDWDILDGDVSLEDCFAKIILECGWVWIPNYDEMEIIWNVLSNLDREDLNRIYYKNNLYEFMSNSKPLNLVKQILHKLKTPLLNSLDIPEEIQEDIKYLSDILLEFVYYRYMYIDRIIRCDNMIKSVVMVSDTDSTIISLDAWYRFIAQQINGEELLIANYCPNPLIFDKEYIENAVDFAPKKYDYDFINDEILDAGYYLEPETTPNQNVRFSIINILAYVLDRVINDYMIQFCKNNNSIQGPSKLVQRAPEKCKILMKNEFTFTRLMTTAAKKNYASLIAVQEGNMVPEKKQLDTKGIEVFTKSTKTESTKEALKKILLEDILKAPVIDQLQVIKDIAIFEHQIIDSVRSGSKEYFKPATIKSLSNYDDPMRIQGIKGATVWNALKIGNLEAIDLNERNAVDIAKVKINRLTAETIKDTYPEVYNNIINLFDEDDNAPGAKTEEVDVKTGKVKKKDNRVFKGSIDAISIPKDTPVPEWLKEFIDYNAIVESNIKGFPYESIGIQRLEKDHVNYTNIVQL